MYSVYVINLTLHGVKGASLGIVGGQLDRWLCTVVFTPSTSRLVYSRLMPIQYMYTPGR